MVALHWHYLSSSCVFNSQLHQQIYSQLICLKRPTHCKSGIVGILYANSDAK